MTLVVYRDGILAGDRRGSRNAVGFELIRDMQKVFVSKCRRLAVAVAGEGIHDKDLPAVMEFFLGSLTDHYYREQDMDYLQEYTMDDAIRMRMTNRHYLLMTQDRVFVINEGKLVDLEGEPWYCIGNGLIMADIFLTDGMGAVKTIKEVAKLSLEVGSTFNRVEQALLKPLIKKVEVV